MTWRRLGRVYVPDGAHAWERTHAFLPTPHVLGDTIRVYYAGLDADRFGRIGWVDVDASNPLRVLGRCKDRVLGLGEPGTFDDSGVNASCVVRTGGETLLYYIGWQRAVRVPYMLFSGLARSDDGSTEFERHARVPVLDRTSEEPFSRSAPFVLEEDGLFRMWYWSGLPWSGEGVTARYRTVIRHATSANGVVWTTTPGTCIEPLGRGDYAVGRPWVLREDGLYRMWYSIRSTKHPRPYRIAYAESTDGLSWQHTAEPVLPPPHEDWDGGLEAYPAVVDAAGRRFLFYNGNGMGATGFGVAEHTG
jgi:hypothetical protein